MFFIETERLKLIPLPYHLLQLSHTNRAAMERSLGLNISAMQVDELFEAEYEDAMINFWLPKTREYPELYQWYTNWEIILKSDNIAIGGIGLAGSPVNGEAETGYMIDKQYHQRGYASEALQAITNWVFGHDDVHCLIAHTYDGNTASKNLLTKNGFVQVADEFGYLTYRLEKQLQPA
ncbi:GNAT family N-acetyltransferase [Mucilaginibacter mali]|uniref:GNAT family N-acetyltransferase n=1 Tax=Mucilaginibacter mali TaxID=2740462 RepID=A0A7D4Q9B6_9SPHI|nr:GNAT family N-acetyltransferase [Mucilaginibacter mali]QKJ31291.1 GNAT family N-acetyltransferase [Mucilaginibacter mali]